MIDSSSSKPGASIEDISPSISKVVGDISPYAHGTSPVNSTFSEELSKDRREEIRTSPSAGESGPSVASNNCGITPKPPISTVTGSRGVISPESTTAPNGVLQINSPS